jgi:phosphoribosyl-ATP pyrophosphohydrolase
MADTIARLEQIIADRRKADPASSYVAKLITSGRAKIAQKVGEEAVETVIAALGANQTQLVSEAADLVFHLAVLLAEQGLSLNDVLAELDRREGTSGIAEKAARNSGPA